MSEVATTAPKKRQRRPIEVGHHRVQLDIQELPAIKGQRGGEYTIGRIHVRTRMKYSEILQRVRSKRVDEVLERALMRMPRPT